MSFDASAENGQFLFDQMRNCPNSKWTLYDTGGIKLYPMIAENLKSALIKDKFDSAQGEERTSTHPHNSPFCGAFIVGVAKGGTQNE